MVLAIGEILFEFIPGTVFCPCISVVVFEMYSLISSLVVMRDREAGALAGTFVHASQFKNSNMGSLGAKRACTRFKNGSRVFRSHVRSSHVLHPLSATRSLIFNVSTCKVVCRRHEDPTNGPTGDPTMVRLPWEL